MGVYTSKEHSPERPAPPLARAGGAKAHTFGGLNILPVCGDCQPAGKNGAGKVVIMGAPNRSTKLAFLAVSAAADGGGLLLHELMITSNRLPAFVREQIEVAAP